MWRTNIENWNKISKDSASLFLELAEKRLDETVETFNNISNRNERLLGFSITLITAILGYLTSLKSNTNYNLYILIVSVLVLAMLFVQLFYLFKNLFSFKIGTKGEEPKLILNQNFVEGYDDDEQYLNLVLQICESYQMKIENNHKVNKIRNKNFMIAIYLLLGIPISFLLAFVFHCLFF